MAKSQETWNKKEKEKIRQKKKEEKDKRKEERKANGGTASFDDMIAYALTPKIDLIFTLQIY